MVTPFKSFKLNKCVNRYSIGVFGYFSFGVLLNGALTTRQSLTRAYVFFFRKEACHRLAFMAVQRFSFYQTGSNTKW